MNTTLKRLALLALLILAIGAVLSTIQPSGPTFQSSPYSPLPTSPLPTPTLAPLQTPTPEKTSTPPSTPTPAPTYTPTSPPTSTPSHWYDYCPGAPNCNVTPQPTYTPYPQPTCYPTPACPQHTPYPTYTPYPTQPPFKSTSPPPVTHTPGPTATPYPLTPTPGPAAHYYVDNTAAPGNGTLDQPWNDLAAAVNRLKPGDILYIRGNTLTYRLYEEPEIDITVSGMPGNPITIQPYGTERVEIHTPGATHIFDIHGDWVVIDGKATRQLYLNKNNVAGANIVYIRSTASDCTIRYTEMAHAQWVGRILRINGDRATIQHCVIHHNYNGDSSDANGIGVDGGHDTIIEYNTIYDVHGDCISIPNDPPNATGTIIRHNTLYTTLGECAENGIGCKANDINANPVQIIGNTLYGFRSSWATCGGGSTNPRGQAIGIGRECDNVIIEDNEIYDSSTGILLDDSVRGITIRHNVIHDLATNDPNARATHGAFFIRAQDVDISGNSIQDAPQSFVFITPLSNVSIHHNTFTRTGTVYGKGLSGWDADYNCWQGTTHTLPGAHDACPPPGPTATPYPLTPTQPPATTTPGPTPTATPPPQGGRLLYVDSHSTGGNGSVDRPWPSVADYVDQLQAGDTLYIRGDVGQPRTYHERKILVTTHGQPGKPITLAAYPGEQVLLRTDAVDRLIEFNDASYWAMRDLTLDGVDDPHYLVYLMNAHHIDFVRLTLQNGHRSGIFIHQADTVLINSCTFRDFFYKSDLDTMGITTLNGTNVEVHNSDFTNIHGDGIIVSYRRTLQDPDPTVLIHSCTFRGLGKCSENAVDVKDGHVQVLYSTFSGFRHCDATCGGSGGDGAAINCHNNARSCQLRRSTISDSAIGLVSALNGSERTFDVHHNTFVNIVDDPSRVSAVVKQYGIGTVYFTHNTIYHSESPDLFWIHHTGADLQATSNVFHTTGNIDLTLDQNLSASYNLWYDHAQRWPGTGDVVDQDPRFVDPSRGDFHLQAGSPAIGAGEGGTNMGAY